MSMLGVPPAAMEDTYACYHNDLCDYTYIYREWIACDHCGGAAPLPRNWNFHYHDILGMRVG